MNESHDKIVEAIYERICGHDALVSATQTGSRNLIRDILSALDAIGGYAPEDKVDAERYRWLRSRDLNTIQEGGVFAGQTPQNVVLNGEDLDYAIDNAMRSAILPV